MHSFRLFFCKQMQALQNLLDYLFDVELQMDIESKNTANNHHRQDMGNKVSVAAGAGDTNTWGGIIQFYWDNILENCLDGSHHVRHSSLKVHVTLFPSQIRI